MRLSDARARCSSGHAPFRSTVVPVNFQRGNWSPVFILFATRSRGPIFRLSAQESRLSGLRTIVTAQSTKRGAILSKQANYLRKTEAMFAA